MNEQRLVTMRELIKHGAIAGKLHALTDDVFRGPIIEEVKRRMNLGSLARVRAGEGAVCRRLQAWIGRLP